MAQTENSRGLVQADSIHAVRWVGIVAALVTASVHLLLGVRMVPSGLGISFLLSGAGFVGAIVLVLANKHRRAVYAAGIPFTLGQIVLWYVINFTDGDKSFPGDIGTLGAIDKVAQVVLVVAVVVLLVTES